MLVPLTRSTRLLMRVMMISAATNLEIATWLVEIWLNLEIRRCAMYNIIIKRFNRKVYGEGESVDGMKRREWKH